MRLWNLLPHSTLFYLLVILSFTPFQQLFLSLIYFPFLFSILFFLSRVYCSHWNPRSGIHDFHEIYEIIKIWFDFLTLTLIFKVFIYAWICVFNELIFVRALWIYTFDQFACFVWIFKIVCWFPLIGGSPPNEELLLGRTFSIGLMFA